jgi:hypothetical protein
MSPDKTHPEQPEDVGEPSGRVAAEHEANSPQPAQGATGHGAKHHGGPDHGATDHGSTGHGGSHGVGHGGEEEGGGHSVGLWYVSFSDMITLLLSFFVMLATFSSYSKDAGKKFAGVCEAISSYSIMGARQETSSLLPPEPLEQEWTRRGSEMPTHSENKDVTNPRPPSPPAGSHAYDPVQLVRIPASRLFWGNGTQLTPAGKDLLHLFGQHARDLSCLIVIRQLDVPGADPARGMDRAAAVMDRLTGSLKIPAGRCSISVAGQTPVEPAIEMTIILGSLSK